jgi:hypothetical protein
LNQSEEVGRVQNADLLANSGYWLARLEQQLLRFLHPDVLQIVIKRHLRMAIPALPDALAAAVRQISDVYEIIAEAAAKGDAALLHQAVDLDQAISNKEAAHIAVDRMQAIHADLLPQFK